MQSAKRMKMTCSSVPESGIMMTTLEMMMVLLGIKILELMEIGNNLTRLNG